MTELQVQLSAKTRSEQELHKTVQAVTEELREARDQSEAKSVEIVDLTSRLQVSEAHFDIAPCPMCQWIY